MQEASMSYLRVPFFQELEHAESILLAGAGGGFDIFCGLPLYFGLREMGKQVHLANLSFSRIAEASGRWLSPTLMEVTATTQGNPRYFPEKYLAAWFRSQGETVSVYCFEPTGVQPLLTAYQALVDELHVDAIILIDGGTDSLMRGDEPGLGTPQEDIASIVAVHQLSVARKLLVCLGFGVDRYHGVCHAYFLEAVSALIRSGGFLGTWSLTREMPEVQRYREATEAVLQAMPANPSIVATSILAALAGLFGDVHMTKRMTNSTLFVNALMTLYWCFSLDPVAERLLYRENVLPTQTYQVLTAVIDRFREALPTVKNWFDLPM